MRDALTSRQLCAAALAGMTVPLTLLAARLHWRWVLLAVFAAALYYYIMYRLKSPTPLAEQAVTVFGGAGKAVLWLNAAWLIRLAGALAAGSSHAFPQTAQHPLSGLLLLALAALAAKNGIRPLVRCAVILLLLLGLLYGTVLIFSTPQVQVQNLAPSGSPLQALGFFPVLTAPTLLLYYRPVRDGTRQTPWLAAGALLALASSVITAGCLSPQLAASEGSFYELSRSVSVLGTIRRFEALISSACLISYFCASAFAMCTAREILFSLLPKQTAQTVPLLPFAVGAALLPRSVFPTVFTVGTATFCAVFPLITQGIGARKKV